VPRNRPRRKGSGSAESGGEAPFADAAVNGKVAPIADSAHQGEGKYGPHKNGRCQTAQKSGIPLKNSGDTDDRGSP